MPLLGSDTWVRGPFDKGVLLLETLIGTEALGAPYRFELGLLSTDPNLDPDQVLGQPMGIGFPLPGGGERCFHGTVTAFAKTGIAHRFTRYRAVLEPLLRQLEHTCDCRVFNQVGQDAVQIVTAVLAERGLTDLEAGALEGRVYREREYCVQYRESDLCFVQRLLEDEGIYYLFRHEASKHTLVLADGLAAHDVAPGYATVPFTLKERRTAGAAEHLFGMRLRRSLYPGQHTVLAGYDPTLNRPKQAQRGDAVSDEPAPGARFEHYDYPGGLYDPKEAGDEASLRTQAERVENTLVEVDGNTLGLGLGHLVTLRPDLESGEVALATFWKPEDLGKQYLVVGASYRLRIDQYETGSLAGSDEPFRATYQLLDTQVPFRPRRTVAKPRIEGPQTAVVVGPADKEIWTDFLGRVMVQFDWDRLGEHDERSSCWMRVSQAWAGARWGAIHIPRIGQEVIVDFLDGDPDRPIVTGRVYNADNLPPYELPGNATQSGIKSRSSAGGTASNFNEIRFEDKKGAEELHLQAERDMSTLVKHCQTLEVGVDRGIVVGNDESTLIKRNRETTVEGNDSVVIAGAHDKTVLGPVLQIYADDHSRKVDGEQELVAEKNKNEHVKLAYTLTTDEKFQLNQDATSLTFEGTNVTLDAAGVVTIMAGGATILVDKAGMVSITSPTGINLICGGSGISLLPGGIALSAAAVTAAAAGGKSKMEMGEKQVEMKSKTVNIEAETTCTVRGKSVLKLNTP